MHSSAGIYQSDGDDSRCNDFIRAIKRDTDKMFLLPVGVILNKRQDVRGERKGDGDWHDPQTI